LLYCFIALDEGSQGIGDGLVSLFIVSG